MEEVAEETIFGVRVGHGYDIHRLVEGRALVLGGVNIPHSLGLEGHSDADVLLHAIMDALLGAVGIGDIGKYFPNTEEQWKDASSLQMVDEVNMMLRRAGWRIGNIDATVIAEAPRIGPHVPEMRRTISRHLGSSPERVNIKATTAEGVGPEGRQEAISAHAVALLFGP